jgi:hypothetical protein
VEKTTRATVADLLAEKGKRRRVQIFCALQAISALIERINLMPGPKRGEIAATLHGDLGMILECSAQKENTPGKGASGISDSAIAGTGFGLYRTMGVSGRQRRALRDIT